MEIAFLIKPLKFFIFYMKGYLIQIIKTNETSIKKYDRGGRWTKEELAILDIYSIKLSYLDVGFGYNNYS